MAWTAMLRMILFPGHENEYLSRVLTIWSNAAFPQPATEKLLAAMKVYRFVISKQSQESNLVSSGEDPDLPNADVAFGQPDPDQAMICPKLKWIHLTSAGYTRYDTKEF